MGQLKICRECGSSYTNRYNSRYCSSLCGFWAQMDKSGGADACWIWRGNKTNCGYGNVHGWLVSKLLGGPSRRQLAHRVAYQLHSGEHPGDLKVTHRCDTPSCANPRHLVLRTQKGNIEDGLSRGRPLICAPGERNIAARLTEDDIRMIRASAMKAGDLASRLGVSRSAINAARRRLTWRHVDDGAANGSGL